MWNDFDLGIMARSFAVSVLVAITMNLLEQGKFKISLIVPCICIVGSTLPLLLEKPCMPYFLASSVVMVVYIWQYRRAKREIRKKIDAKPKS